MKSKKYLIGGAVAIVLLSAVVIDSMGMFKGSLFELRGGVPVMPVLRECTKADIVVSTAVDSPNGAVLAVNPNAPMGKFNVSTGNCRLSVSKLTGRLIARGVEVN